MDHDDGSKGQAASEADASFEQVLGRLQQVVERLEEGDMPLQESLARFEEGVRLSRLGARRLDEAERRVEQLLETDEGVQTRPLAGGGAASGRRRGAKSQGADGKAAAAGQGDLDKEREEP